MNRDKNLPLTETVYYILLALLRPAHGYLILQRVEELSAGQVRLAAGTLYGALENLVKLRFIDRMDSEDPRRKVYGITQEGRRVLQADCARMQQMLNVTQLQLKEGQAHETV